MEMEMKMVMEAEPDTATAVLVNDGEEIQSSANPLQSTAADEIIIASSDCPSKETAEPTTENKREREDQDEDMNASELETTDSDQKRPLWKTSLCSYFRGKQGCSHGDSCCYAHGEAELRPRPGNSWDPSSERVKKLQKTTTTNRSQAQKEEEEAAAAGEDTIDASSLDKCLIGLPRKWASDNLKKFLDARGILYKSAKKKKKMAVGFVVFESVEQVKDAIEVLNEKSAGGKQIKIANATRRSHEKHTFETTESHPGNKDHYGDTDAADNGTSITEGLVPKTRSVRDVVTPLAHMPYSDQLEHKKNSLLQALKRLTKNARKACPDAVPLPEWILKSRETGGLPCKFEGILESPVIDGYRNKCEFSVGYSLQGKRTVGFMLGNFREGVTAVEEPVNCPNVSRISCKYALIFQEFLQSSVFPVWNRIDNTGFWRQFTVREGRNPGQAAAHENLETPIAEVMLIIQVCSQGVDEEQMKIEFKRMAHALAQGAASCSPPLPLTTMVVQDHKGISNAAPADCPLLPLPIPNVEGLSTPEKSCVSDLRIHDYLSNLRFSLSPTAFFQVNTLAAERLYSLAADWAELSPDTLLFDICCGTGTIGLTLAHRVGMVVGIEMNESAVQDAHRNAQINGIKNCNFVCGKAEDVIGALLKEYLGLPQQKIVAPDVSGSNDVNKDANGSCDTKNEKLLADAGVTMNTRATNASAEGKTLLCEQSESFGVSKHLDRESTIDFNKEDGCSDSLADESSNLETSGTNNSRTFLKSNTTECRPTSKENEDCRDTDQDILKDSDTNKENDEYRTTGEDGYVSEEKGIKAASVCHFKDIVAIVDPPRVGLHPTVIRALRTHPRIRRLVYVSCNPESLVANAIELCTPASDKLEREKGNWGWRNMSSAGLARHRTKSMPVSEPFSPVKAVAVDLFPHTPHCEMVMLLER